MKDNLMPLFNQLKGKWEDREQLREEVLKNLKQTRDTLEVTAKEVIKQTKDSKLVSDYVRPMIESAKAEEALQKLEENVTQAGPVVAKLREFRQQFLDATKPVKAPRKKKTAKEARD